MRTRTIVVALLTVSTAAPVAAQRTHDQARLSLGLAIGGTVGRSLWSVTNQPIDDGLLTDTLSLERDIRAGLAVVFHGTYFPSDHWGFTGEAMLIGLGFEDQCRQLTSSLSSDNAAVCNSIRGHDSPGSAVGLSVGALYRVWSRKVVSPYVRAHAGFIISQHSAVELNGSIPVSSVDASEFRVYVDNNRPGLTPVLGLGVGFTAALGPGYQLRWEFRDNIAGLEQVTGPTAANFQEPPSRLSYQHVLSVTFGFDIVLERKRGRRY